MGAAPSAVRAGLGGADMGGLLQRLPRAVVDVIEFWGLRRIAVVAEVAVATREVGELEDALARVMPHG